MRGRRLSRIFRYVTGYLRLRVWGREPERFVSLCAHRDILVWDIRNEGDCYRMSVGLHGFYRMREPARKTGTRAVVAGRRGLPFLLPGLKNRAGFLAGLLAAGTVWCASRCFVWDIELDGNLRISDDQLYTFLEEQDVHIGMPVSALDIEELEKALRRGFDQLTWTSVRQNGVRLRISLKENESAAPGETETTADIATSLVSEYTGTIVEMVVRSGVPQVGIGDRVAEGTLLVDGLVPIYNDDQTVASYQLTRADADIILEHQRIYRARLPFETTQKTYTGRERGGILVRIGTREWHLAVTEPYLYYDTVTTINRPYAFAKLGLPIFAGHITAREYQNTEREYTLSEAEALLNEKCGNFLTDLEQKGVQIIEKDVKIDTDDSGWFLEGVFLVREQIGKSVAVTEGEPASDE